MSLDYELGDVPDWKVLNRGLIECMVFSMMFIGMNRITPENAKEVYTRISLREKLFGPIRADQTPLTRDDVNSFIGLRTNVSTESKAAFRKRMFDNFEREIR